jgi:hypothetical protein
MELMSLAAIGWIFTLCSAGALALGAWLVIGAHYSGEPARNELARRAFEDAVLFGIWIFGLAGGIGVLLEKAWSRGVLELFCWVLMVLALLTAWSRYRVAPRPRSMLVVSLVLFLLPLLGLCGATILTLRSEAALRILSG